MSGTDGRAESSNQEDEGGPGVAPFLDAANRAIIEALQCDGRQPYGAIAQAVGLSEAAVRRRVQRETLGHRGRKDDPLYGVRRLLTRGWERLSEHQEERLLAALRRGDPFDEVGAALVAKEELRQMYAAGSPASARDHLERFYELARKCGVGEVARLSRTVRRWETPILSFFVTGHTNAKSEAQNLITEKLRRIAHGMRNFENYRLRLLLHSGVQWDTRPTARIRGRQPRLVA